MQQRDNGKLNKKQQSANISKKGVKNIRKGLVFRGRKQ